MLAPLCVPFSVLLQAVESEVEETYDADEMMTRLATQLMREEEEQARIAELKRKEYRKYWRKHCKVCGHTVCVVSDSLCWSVLHPVANAILLLCCCVSVA